MLELQWLLESNIASWANRRLPVHSRAVDAIDRRITRNQSMVLFGAMNGRMYGDNSRYVYEWILKNRDDLHPIWITLDQDVKSQLEAEGKPVRMATSIGGLKALFEAGAAMITNNFYDIALHPIFVPPSLPLIHLTHGVPVKQGAENKQQHADFEAAYKQKRSRLTKARIHTAEFLMNEPDSEVNRITGYLRNDPLLEPPEGINSDSKREKTGRRQNIIEKVMRRSVTPDRRGTTQPHQSFSSNVGSISTSSTKISNMCYTH